MKETKPVFVPNLSEVGGGHWIYQPTDEEHRAMLCRHPNVKDHKCVDCGRTVEIELPVATCAQCAGLIGNDPVRVVLSFDSLGLYFAGWDYTTATVYHAGCES